MLSISPNSWLEATLRFQLQKRTFFTVIFDCVWFEIENRERCLRQYLFVVMKNV